MDRAEEFIEMYKELEAAAARTYGYPSDGKAVWRLSQRREFNKLSGELAYCREVRNLLQHRPKVRDHFLVEPSQEMVDLLRETLERVEHPVRCQDVAVPFSRMYWRGPEDPVLPAFRGLRKGSFTHIPILDNRRVWGIFSVNALFNYLLAYGPEALNDTVTFLDMDRYLRLDAHPSELFVFLSARASVDEADACFERALQKGKRVGMVFLTETAKPTEKVQGILTAWDLVGN